MKKPPLNSIEYQQFNFKITAKESINLPAYKDSTFQGGWGYAFKRVVCATLRSQTNSISFEFRYED